MHTEKGGTESACLRDIFVVDVDAGNEQSCSPSRLPVLPRATEIVEDKEEWNTRFEGEIEI